MSADKKLQEMGITLPTPPQPAGAYTRAVRHGDLVFVAGQLPMTDGKVQYIGKVGRELSPDDGYAAARLCALNALSILQAELGSLDNIVRIVRVAGFVASAEGFTAQPKVINGASELLHAVLGERGIHARVAVGVAELPLGAGVEVEVTAAVE
jgi:enamine deaminase RidA (YjgF/YER057c/UK114 family)